MHGRGHRQPADSGDMIPPELLVNATISPESQKRLVSLVEVVPNDDLKVSLGVYTRSAQPQGILITFDSRLGDNISAQLMQIGNESSAEYELKVYLMNYGYEPITVEIWELSEGHKK